MGTVSLLCYLDLKGQRTCFVVFIEFVLTVDQWHNGQVELNVVCRPVSLMILVCLLVSLYACVFVICFSTKSQGTENRGLGVQKVYEKVL